MAYSVKGIHREIKEEKEERQKLGTDTGFKFFGAVVTDDGPKPEFSQGLLKPLQLC